VGGRRIRENAVLDALTPLAYLTPYLALLAVMLLQPAAPRGDD
jgi:hypothetical protein